MLLFLQALLIAALIPVLEIQARMSARIKILSEIDAALAKKSARLSASCEKIQKLNRKLRVLEAECIAAAKNPALTAPLISLASGIVFQQEALEADMHMVVLTPDRLLRGLLLPSTRDFTKPCLTTGELHWPASSVAEFTSESGGAITLETLNGCRWEFHDPRVRPL